MSAILREDPPELSGEHLRVPMAVERLVRRCLEKEPSQRFQSARDLAFALEAVEGSSTSSGVATALGTPGRARRPTLLMALGLLAVLAVAVAYYGGLRRGGAEPRASEIGAGDPVRLTPLTFRPMIVFEAAFAPDHRTVVFSASEEGTTPSIYTVSPDYPDSKARWRGCRSAAPPRGRSWKACGRPPGRRTATSSRSSAASTASTGSSSRSARCSAPLPAI